LIHDILENFILDSREKGRLPSPASDWSDADKIRLHKIAETKFSDAKQRGVTGRNLMWRIAKDEILSDLDAFLDEDSAMRRLYGVSPALVEANFGLNDAGWREAICELPNGDPIRFRGKIDRVDLAPNGKRVLVLDYKTCGKTAYQDNFKEDPVIGRGKHLQLAIYSLAAQQAYGSDYDVSAAYWFVNTRSNFVRIPSSPVNIGDENVMSRFKDGVSTITDGIRSGIFPANPGELDLRANRSSDFKNCGWCDFKTLCPSNRDRQWQHKSNDPRVAGYLSLVEGEIEQAKDER